MREMEHPIKQALKSNHDRRRKDALFQVVNENLIDLGDDVLKLMKEKQGGEIKGLCAWALGRLNHREAYPFLVHNLEDASAEVPIWSAQALGKMSLERAAKHLSRAMDRESDDSVRMAMGGAIRKLSGENVRVHSSRVRKELDSLRLPFTEDRIIGVMVYRLQQLRWPGDRDEILQIREEMKNRDQTYFEADMKWAQRTPALLRSLDDDTIVFS